MEFEQTLQMDSEWRLLSLDYSDTDSTPLLVKYKIDNSSYVVWLSNVVECWTEALDRKQIIKRAFEIDTSIDPSEGADQFRSLLRCLRDALAEKPGANLTVQKQNAEEIVLALKSSLPGTLAPLEWYFNLRRSDQSAFTDQFVMPLLDQKLADTSTISLLLTEIREKDKLISKLMEAIQADGVSMSRIFPSLQPSKTRVRSYSRQILGKTVKGMSEFDETKSCAELGHVDHSSLSPFDLVSKAFPDKKDNVAQIHPFGDLCSWRNLVRASAIQSEGESAPAVRHAESGVNVENGQEAKQSSQPKQILQEQEKPTSETSYKSHSPQDESKLPLEVSNEQLECGESTTDSDNDDHNPPYKKRISNKSPSQSSQKTSSLPIRHSRSLSPGDPIASNQDDEHSLELGPPQPKSGSDDLSTPKKGKIGRIGGKRQNQAKNSPTSPEARHPCDQDKPSTAKTTNYGHTDGRRHNTSRSNLDENSEAEPAQQLRETSRERVSKKREALKRELEAKSQAAGKKKRRF